MDEPEHYQFSPIGYLRTHAKFRFEAPRQPVFSDCRAWIDFLPDDRLRVAAEDLRGVDRIWVVFCFHLNLGKSWRPKVRPPISPDNARYGVFATRSPHRPNPIGISCVELLSIEKNGLLIRNSDMLDGTPVFDIKPYIPEADSFPGSAAGWRDGLSQQQKTSWEIQFSARAEEKQEFLLRAGGWDLAQFCRIQIGTNPLDQTRKRISPDPLHPGAYLLGYRTWKIRFIPDESLHSIQVSDILSNYSSGELLPGAEDPYMDKSIHREFLAQYKETEQDGLA